MPSVSDSLPNSNPPNRNEGELKHCGSCHAVGYDEDIYCARCGKIFGPACLRCGKRISHPVAFYCVWCGEKLDR